MTQDRDQDREAFEAWALPRGWTINRDHSDWYVDDSTSRAWAIWQACAAAKDARIAEMKRDHSLSQHALRCEVDRLTKERDEARASEREACANLAEDRYDIGDAAATIGYLDLATAIRQRKSES